jgi:hypothetical protein
MKKNYTTFVMLLALQIIMLAALMMAVSYLTDYLHSTGGFIVVLSFCD